MDKSEQRIHAVLGDDNERTPKNARRYLVHLKKHLSLPLRVTGIEDLPWEEPYVFGYRDQNRYEEMKKTNPSYTDEFDLIDILDPEFDDLIARVNHLKLSFVADRPPRPRIAYQELLIAAETAGKRGLLFPKNSLNMVFIVKAVRDVV